MRRVRADEVGDDAQGEDEETGSSKPVATSHERS